VTVVAPGYFESAMGDRFTGRKPLRMGLDEAAGRIHRAILAGRPRLEVPAALAWVTRLVALLPARWSDAAIRLHRFRVTPEA
jgi:broad specificity polyphosphatase/5'/3'-nucleotidase SurE